MRPNGTTSSATRNTTPPRLGTGGRRWRGNVELSAAKLAELDAVPRSGVVLPPLFLVVASSGLVSANATVLGVKRAPAAGAASAVLGTCMFGGGILVSPLMALGDEG